MRTFFIDFSVRMWTCVFVCEFECGLVNPNVDLWVASQLKIINEDIFVVYLKRWGSDRKSLNEKLLRTGRKSLTHYLQPQNSKQEGENIICLYSWEAAPTYWKWCLFVSLSEAAKQLNNQRCLSVSFELSSEDAAEIFINLAKIKWNNQMF